MPARRIELSRSRSQEVIANTAESLRRGQLVALPTETVYGLAMRPGDANAVAKAQALLGSNRGRPFATYLADASAAEALADVSDPRVGRLCARYWPGPLALWLPSRSGGTIELCVPAHDFTRAVIRAVGEPVWFAPLKVGNEAPLCDPATIEARFGAQLDLLLDAGPTPLGNTATVVRCTGAELEVLHEGILSRAEILATAASTVLFVCTGNTCRSPLAEVLAREVVANALNLSVGRVAARGLRFQSAGTGTMNGVPASEGSMAAAAEVGLDLTSHSSTQLQKDLALKATRIHCLSNSHLLTLLDLVPEVEDRVSLLRPDNEDIADPYGGNLKTYRPARDQIAAAVTSRLPAWLALLPRIAQEPSR